MNHRPPPPRPSFYRAGTFEEEQNPDIAASRDFAFPPASGAYTTLPPGQSHGPQLPPRGNVPGEAPFSHLQFPPRGEKIAGSVDFRVSDYTLALPAVVGGTVLGPSFRIPKDQVGWLQNNEIYVLAPTAATHFSMAIRINNGPVPGYDDIQMPPGIAFFVRAGDDEMRIRVPNGALVSILFTNISGTAETVGGLLQGWSHPVSAEARVWGPEEG